MGSDINGSFLHEKNGMDFRFFSDREDGASSLLQVWSRTSPVWCWDNVLPLWSNLFEGHLTMSYRLSNKLRSRMSLRLH